MDLGHPPADGSGNHRRSRKRDRRGDDRYDENGSGQDGIEVSREHGPFRLARERARAHEVPRGPALPLAPPSPPPEQIVLMESGFALFLFVLSHFLTANRFPLRLKMPLLAHWPRVTVPL